MITNPVIFYIATFFIILFALLSIFAKNVIYSLLSAIVVFFMGAIFFYILGSEYNAIIQAAIYGFAVPILIGISIMFMSKNNREKKSFALPYISLLCSLIFALAFVYLIMISLTIVPDTFHIMELVEVNSFDTIRIFARSIFINYVWSFELFGLLLTIIIVGLGIMKKRGI